MKVVAVVPVRNERAHLPYLLGDLLDDGCDVVLIDNASSDGTQFLVGGYPRGRVRCVPLPWSGRLDLAQMLTAAQEAAEDSGADWAVLHAADEWLQSPVPGESLGRLLARSEGAGFTVVDFREFVFLPPAGYRHGDGDDVRRRFLDYYHHAPQFEHLNRAWKLGIDTDIVSGAGHVLYGPHVRLGRERGILRHYPVLDWTKGSRKYRHRRYPDDALARGWHGTRRGLELQEPAAEQFAPFIRSIAWWGDLPEAGSPAPRHIWEA